MRSEFTRVASGGTVSIIIGMQLCRSFLALVANTQLASVLVHG